ncbi:MAG: YegS/Rv2252/BmrU family lipid kinase [Candidatus Eremiobacteraeota bacterium]|nr:YegS/Rv2252/BmrU family lipid kinase [Candidatus Eremiobacteraeota bacterium]
MRALLQVNRNSRLGTALGDQVRAELEACGIQLVDADSPQAASERPDCIVAVGGDGTIARMIPRAIELGVPLGVVPIGTFNELARTLGIPFDVSAACATIGAGHTRTIDVARVNGAYYTSEASLGVSSRIARLQKPQDKQRFGFLAIVASVFQAIRHIRPMRAEVEFDGRVERFKTVQLTIANSDRFGGILSVSDASIDNGWLDLYSVDIHNVYEAFSVARAMIQGKREPAPGLRTYRSTRFSVRTRHRHRISADGESAGRTPAVFEVLPKALDVIVP